MIFDSVTARNSIYLDFEGEGQGNNAANAPLPHMAGIFRPNPKSGGGGTYESVFFRESWKAPANGSNGRAHIDKFDRTIENLIKEAEEKNSFIVFWSDYERSVINLNTPHILELFDSVSFNLLPPLRTIKNQRHIDIDQGIEKVLNQYLKAFLPARPLVPTGGLGPAEACRRIDKFSNIYPMWHDWPNKKKQYLNDLLDYNEKDCRATWWLGKKLGNINENKITVR